MNEPITLRQTNPPDASAGATPRRERTWAATLTLLVMAPAVAEMLSGSTPPLLFVNPVNLLFDCGLYGCSALLIREVVRRRRLGWSSVLLLGAAYGVLEEGLVITSWFNPYWPDLGPLASFGRALNTNWIWALGLTAYHMIVSITIPIVLVEALFPHFAGRPWLGRGGALAIVTWLAATSLIGLLAFGFIAYHVQGYAHPPLMWFGALVFAAGLVAAALLLPRRTAVAPVFRATSSVWGLRVTAFLLTVGFFLVLWAMPSFIPWPWLVALALIAIVALALWLLHRAAREPGWSARHRVALATGSLAFFLVLAPLLEFGTHGSKPYTGMTGATLCWLAFFVWLSRRAARAESALQPAYTP